MAQAQTGDKSRGLLARGWRNIRAAGAQRLALTALLLVAALLAARFSWDMPVLNYAEKAFYDFRSYHSAPDSRQDERIQVIVYNDQTLINVRKRSPLDRGLLARTLQNIDSMGAKAIGIDMLFDQPQDEDDELVATLRAMKTPVFIAYIHRDSSPGDIVWEQQQYLDAFMQRLEGSNAKPASVMLEYPDGVARSWPKQLDELPLLLGPAMVGTSDPAATAPFKHYTGPIRYQLAKGKQERVFSQIPIDTFGLEGAPSELLAALSEGVRDRYILIGGDIVDTDRVVTPFTTIDGKNIPGIEVHAAMITQMLDGAHYMAPKSWQRWAMAALIVLAAGLTALLDVRTWLLAPVIGAQFALFPGLPIFLESIRVDTIGTPSVGWAVGWIIAFVAISSAARASGAVERKFAQDALGKYLPGDIAQEIIDNPERLTLSGTKSKLYILFSDLEGFTALSHQLEPEVVASLLNEYLDRLSAAVLQYGGVIDKYVGDAVVAFWGAPIARPDDAEKAARAGYALWQAGEEFRRSVDPSLPKIGKTRVGMHFGEAVVGNFGGERRIQYTALGDAMNTAARLESANKALDSSVMASRELAERSGLDWWRPMGRVQLRGRARPVDIFEPAPDFPAEDRAELTRAMALIDTDRQAAITVIQDVATRHVEDTALQNLLERTRNLGENNAYVMG